MYELSKGTHELECMHDDTLAHSFTASQNISEIYSTIPY